jgi:hypothetical protein
MIEKCIENWHRNMRGELPGGLESMIADDCVFYSPIVFSPQKGKDLTLLYLNAAGATFSGGGDGQGSAENIAKSGFHYSKEVMSGNHAVLEFETEVQGKYINGIDMITCDGEGKIIEFKVMIRPLQAINLMHQQMAAMLEKLK